MNFLQSNIASHFLLLLAKMISFLLLLILIMCKFLSLMLCLLFVFVIILFDRRSCSKSRMSLCIRFLSLIRMWISLFLMMLSLSLRWICSIASGISISFHSSSVSKTRYKKDMPKQYLSFFEDSKVIYKKLKTNKHTLRINY